MSWKKDFETNAEHLVGKYVLIDISECDSKGNVLSRGQLHGIIKGVKGGMIKVDLAGAYAGRQHTLPPDLDAFKKADPRRAYRLQSTGEEIKGVDYIATWTIEPQKEQRPAEPDKGAKKSKRKW